MKDLKSVAKQLLDKPLTIVTLQPIPTVTHEEADEAGSVVDRYSESGETTINGELDDVLDDWIIVSTTYRSKIYTYYIRLENIVAIYSEEPTPEALERFRNSATTLAASRSKKGKSKAKGSSK